MIFSAIVGTGKFAAVSADESRAAEIGRDILQGGGNAIDAAAAMYFAMAVTLPSAAGLGASGACILQDEKSKAGDVEVTSVDIAGTYLFKAKPFDPNEKPTDKPDFRMVGVIFASKNGPYFMRLVGPAKTVEKHKKEFDGWLKGFK